MTSSVVRIDASATHKRRAKDTQTTASPNDLGQFAVIPLWPPVVVAITGLNYPQPSGQHTILREVA